MPYLFSDNKNDCCGCSACSFSCPQNAISMTVDEKGFSYPLVNMEKCVECKLCEKICGFKAKDKENTFDKKVYAVKANSDEIRTNSSSGGVFSLLSDVVLEKGGVVYGAIMDENFKVKHIRADSVEERNKCRGSKYSQSDINTVFLSVRDDLNNGKLVMFTGTPCQVDGLKRFIGNKDANNLLLVDLVCHGAMSPVLFQNYIKFLEDEKNKKVALYIHRPKDCGWGHIEKIIFSDNSSEIGTRLSDVWKEVFYKNTGLRPSCYNCVYASEDRCSDITMADFWGINKIDADFADNKGVSLVIINSEKGRVWFEKIQENCQFCEKSIDDALPRNINLKAPSSTEIDQQVFWNEFYKHGFKFIAKKYGRYTLVDRFKRWVKNLIKRYK